ncbi:MAG: HipA N-terminal domain-containing protein [Deltaproteobacteria bacterium]
MKFKEINVFFDNGTYKRSVGILAMVANKILFEYDNAWIDSHLELAPIQLPTSRRSFQFETSKLVNSVPGLFGDSLPDGWGLLIMDRFFNKKGIKRDEITPIDRLAYLGEDAMGALCYKPSLDHENNVSEAVGIGETARDAYELFEGNVEDASRLLAKIGGSPGGTRPKVLIGISDSGREFVSGIGALPDGFSHWMIKFSGLGKNELRSFGPYEGVLEYIYLEIAKAAGINVFEYCQTNKR